MWGLRLNYSEMLLVVTVVNNTDCLDIGKKVVLVCTFNVSLQMAEAGES